MTGASDGSLLWAKRLVEDKIIPMVAEGRHVDLIKLVRQVCRDHGTEMTDRRDAGRNCGTCDYWQRVTTNGPPPWVGRCHRHAPQIELKYRFPTVMSTDWCGEYVAMEKPE